MRRFLISVASVAVVSFASAQPSPPDAGVAAPAAATATGDAGVAPEGASRLAAPEALPAGHAPVSEEALRRVLGEGRPLTTATASDDVPPRTVVVRVVDERDLPRPNVRVRFGTLDRGTRREPVHANTDASGLARFTVPEGVGGAHRVTIEYDGVRVQSAPFTLEPTRGHRVELRRLPTTTELRVLLQRQGQLVVEWKPGRMHISQSTELMNLGEDILSLGSGIHVQLPEGFLAFEAEQSMNDVRVESVPDGVKLVGSLPPGRVMLQWTYDVPLSGTEASLRMPMAFAQTATYQVVVDAAPTMGLSVEGFPPAERVNYQGRELLHTEIDRGPQDPPLRELAIDLEGIPGPNPGRWPAVVAALVMLAALVVARVAGRRGKVAGLVPRDLERRDALLDAVLDLEADHAAGKVGDVFFRRERERLVDELALLERHRAASA